MNILLYIIIYYMYIIFFIDKLNKMAVMCGSKLYYVTEKVKNMKDIAQRQVKINFWFRQE